MSGRPSPDGVKRVRDLLDAEARLSSEANRLKEMIANATKRLDQVNHEHGLSCRERTKLMAQMSLTSSGEFGYEERMSWFLIELVRQTKEAAPERVVYEAKEK